MSDCKERRGGVEGREEEVRRRWVERRRREESGREEGRDGGVERWR